VIGLARTVMKASSTKYQHTPYKSFTLYKLCYTYIRNFVRFVHKPALNYIRVFRKPLLQVKWFCT